MLLPAIWFYCSQVNPKTHCNAGMVGAINAPTTGNTFDNFQSNAKGLPSASILQPTPALLGVGASASAGLVTTDSVSVPSTTGSSGTGTASNGGSSSTGTSTGTSTGASSTNTGSGAGAVGVNGVVAFVAAAFGVALL